MSRTFHISVKDHPELLLNKARQLALSYAVHFTADPIQGHFCGKGLEGSYRFDQNTLIVTVVKKPPFITWTMIEQMLHRLFA